MGGNKVARHIFQRLFKSLMILPGKRYTSQAVRATVTASRVPPEEKCGRFAEAVLFVRMYMYCDVFDARLFKCFVAWF